MENKSPAWDDLRVFLEVARTGTFLAAGKRLNLSTSTVARRVGALERRLHRPLVHRTSQGTRIDPDAKSLVAMAEAFERALAAEHRAPQGSATLTGSVRLSVPEGVSAQMAEAAVQLATRHPGLRLEVVAEGRFVDLSSREADLAIRAGRTGSPALVELPLGPVVAGLYAAPKYLDRALPSRHLTAAELSRAAFITEPESPTARMMKVLEALGARHFSFQSNSIEAQVIAAKQGLGLMFVAVGTAERFPELERVRVDATLPVIEFFLTMHASLRGVPRVKVVTQEIKRRFEQYLEAQQRAELAFERRWPTPKPGAARPSAPIDAHLGTRRRRP